MALYRNKVLVSGIRDYPAMTWAEYQALPVAQRPKKWICTDRDYTEIPKESVSVTTDGTLTYTSIFNSLFALVDISKLTCWSVLEDAKNVNVNIYSISQFTSTQIIFGTSRPSSSGTGCEEAILNTSTSTYYHCEGTSRQDWGTAKPSSGHVFTIYY